MSTSRRAVLGLAAATPLAGLLAACGDKASTSSSTSTSTSTSTTTPSGAGSGAATGSGAVKVLYAGSLVTLMTKQLGPAFARTGPHTVDGFAGGSNGLATQIKGGVRQADVFISASPSADEQLMGQANGNRVTWYAQFATAALVLGYNPRSKYAADITSKPWYDVLSLPGIKVGATDPATDPKGKLAHEALLDAGKQHPALLQLANNTRIVHGEENMVGQLQAGQLDVAFFYASEAKAANIQTIPLTGQDRKAVYTVTIPSGAPNQAGAEAFVKYLLGSDAQAVMKSDGFTLTSPAKLTGTGVPASLASLVR